IPLLPGSPAIGAGNAQICATTTGIAPVNGLDQRGVARPDSGPSGVCDVGALQSQGFTLAKANGRNQTASIGSALAARLLVPPTANQAGSPYFEPVQNGVVTFTGPGSGAGIQNSPLKATIGSNGQASQSVTANATTGSFSVSASASGAAAV